MGVADNPALDGGFDSKLYVLLLYEIFFTAPINFTLLPSVLPFDFTVQTLAPKTHVGAQKSHFPSLQKASSKSTGDIIVTLFFLQSMVCANVVLS